MLGRERNTARVPSSAKIVAKDNKKSCSDAELLLVVFDVLMAGMETTVTTLKWALLFMIRNTKVSTSAVPKYKRTLAGATTSA